MLTAEAEKEGKQEEPMQKVILAVIPETGVRTGVIGALEGEGYLVLAVSDAALALDVVLHTPIALVILDLALPDGPALSERLRASALTARLPLLMLLSSPGEEVPRGLHEPGLDDFLRKPFAWDDLRRRVQGLLHSGRYLQKVLLLVERSGDSRAATVSRLQQEGFIVLAAADAARALELARDNPVSLVILDQGSLRRAGADLCRQLRTAPATAAVPLLMLVESEGEMVQLVASDFHADDFLIRPFHWEELRACLHALLRMHRRATGTKRAPVAPRKRVVAPGGSQVLVADDLCVDVGRFSVTQGGQEIKFGSPLLFDLLVYLLRHRGVVLTREQILQEVWGSEPASVSRTLDVHVHWLRQKLQDDPTHPRLIQTVPGVGYLFKA